MSDYTAVETAIVIAVSAHEGQTDESGHPYILHPLRVMSKFNNPLKQAAAVLHDVIEDTEVTGGVLNDLGIPADVIDAVTILTHEKDDESYDDYIDTMALEAGSVPGDIAIAVKLADLEDNMSPWRNHGMAVRLDEHGMKRYKRYLKAWNKLKGLTKEAEAIKE